MQFVFKGLSLDVGNFTENVIPSMPTKLLFLTWNELTVDIGMMPIQHQAIVPDSKVHGANMGPIWSWQDPGGPHVGLINFAIWDNIDNADSCDWVCQLIAIQGQLQNIPHKM